VSPLDGTIADAGEAARGRRLLGQILKDHDIVRESQVQEALGVQRKQGGLIGQCLVELKSCTQGDVSRALAEQAGMEVVELACHAVGTVAAEPLPTLHSERALLR
jgi:type IV pilus assembly protein PilB